MKNKKSFGDKIIRLLSLKKLRQALRVLDAQERMEEREMVVPFWGASVTDTAPAISSPPADLLPGYTMNGKIPLRYSYFNDTVSTPLVVSREQYDSAFAAFAAKNFVYYHNSLDFFYDALDKYPATGKTVLVYGLAATNCEAFAVWRGAARVIVVDYNAPICDHERIYVMTHKEIAEKGIKADIAISFSSFEHDGLGRYGDQLAPDGDLKAMGFAWEHLTDGGLLLLGVPLGKDCLVWNAHRIYGRHRLPLLLRDWDVMDVYGKFIMPMDEQSIFDVSTYEGGYMQPLMVLRKTEESVIDYNALLKRSNNAECFAADKGAKTVNPIFLSEILRVKYDGKDMLPS